ncbi:hypothetical protein HV205_26425 [Klebsiella sp. RHBSTW-00465]|uniref:hypothetical protein n=1 Tax=Klebsiella sp. RHBSTW-00465 TaxID=2742650 RepID=UPI0015F656C3|nr:hypothetical protein [Klebsiella sp. RHBSTW-00465]MBA7847944.1 hypothetical protein [Klebsiella sp. RHBSTW-00465]
MKQLMVYLIILCTFFMTLCKATAFEIGVNIHVATFPGNTISLMETLRKYNIDSIRVDYSWSGVEKSKGIYTIPYEKLDSAITTSLNEGVTPLVILNYGNQYYKSNTGGHKNIRLSTVQEVKGFMAYSNWVTKHLGKKKIIYEIWNEWNHSQPKIDSNGIDSAKSYVLLVKQVSAIIKKNNPDAIVIAGGFNPMSRKELAWGEKIVSLGILSYIDGLSIHPYDWTYKKIPNTAESFNKLRIAHDGLVSVSGNQKVDFYITEVGVSSFSKILFPEKKIGEYLLSYYKQASQTPFIKGVWWYCFVNKGNDLNDFESNFGLLDQNGTPKISAEYLQMLSIH